MRSDSDIERDVRKELKSRPDLDATDIGVSVTDGVVALSGFTHSNFESQYQREAAMRAVRRVKGIGGVSNLIKLKPRAEPVDIKRKIEERREAQRATKG